MRVSVMTSNLTIDWDLAVPVITPAERRMLMDRRHVLLPPDAWPVTFDRRGSIDCDLVAEVLEGVE